MIELARKIAYWQYKLKSSRSKAFKAQMEVLAKEEGYASAEVMKEAISTHAKKMGSVYSAYIDSPAAIEHKHYNGARISELKTWLNSRRWA